jgi:hypothetical protein
MPVVGGRSDSAVAVSQTEFIDSFGKPFGKFAAMVGLKRFEFKRSEQSGLFHKFQALMVADSKKRKRLGPPGTNIKKRIHVQSFFRLSNVDGVDFHQISWLFRHRSGRIRMPLLPLARVRQMVSFECSFD